MRAFRVIVNGSEYDVTIEEIKGGAALADAHIAKAPAPAPAPARPERPAAEPAQENKPAMKAVTNDGSGETIVAQMPGTIVDILVKPGEAVTRGQHLLVLEAMKMANQVVAHQDGTVNEILVASGDLVNAGDVLIILS